MFDSVTNVQQNMDPRGKCQPRGMCTATAFCYWRCLRGRSRQATDDMFNKEMSLKEWVSMAMKENAEIEAVAATGLLFREDEHFGVKEQCILFIFEVAMGCLALSPSETSNMKEVMVSLN